MPSNRRPRLLQLLQLGFAILMVMPVTGLRGQPTTSDLQERPNILLLISDDQRADTIAAYGNSHIVTPNLDRLVQRGVNFRNAYCLGSDQGAVCIASRAMMLAGKSYFRLKHSLDGEVTYPQRLREAGYQTFGTGKWHNGRESFQRSFAAGRNVFFGGMSDHTKVPLCDLDPETNEFSPNRIGDGFSSELFADAAIDFLKHRNLDQPFLCCVYFTAPHDPRMPPADERRNYNAAELPLPKNFLPQHPFNTGSMTIRDECLAGWPRTPEVIREQTADYYAMITHLDRQVGRILAAVEQSGDAENTWIVYTSDHGLAMGSHGLLGKQSLYEHSMKAPLIICPPGRDQNRRDTDELVYLMDIAPTVCAIGGTSLGDNLDAMDLNPVVIGRPLPHNRSVLGLAYSDEIRSIRNARWKMIQWPKIARTQIFDLANDPDERVDLVDSAELREGLAEELETSLAQWRQKMGDDQRLEFDPQRPLTVDLSNFVRKPDGHQPQSIIDKYFQDEKR